MPSSLPVEHEENDETSTSPLNKAYFSNPVYRRRVTFVPAAPATLAADTPVSTGTFAADRYSSIVFGSTAADTEFTSNSNDNRSLDPRAESLSCPICHVPLPVSLSETVVKSHECLLAHQLSLPHSHPPSHLPRSNKGLQYLSSYGWDPDSRQGLGADGEGIRVPVKPKVKADTVGLGVSVDKNRTEKPKPVMLDAGKVRKLENKDRKQRQKLEREFWGRDDIEKYLGPE